jgi:hypothetical protein
VKGDANLGEGDKKKLIAGYKKDIKHHQFMADAHGRAAKETDEIQKGAEAKKEDAPKESDPAPKSETGGEGKALPELHASKSSILRSLDIESRSAQAQGYLMGDSPKAIQLKKDMLDVEKKIAEHPETKAANQKARQSQQDKQDSESQQEAQRVAKLPTWKVVNGWEITKDGGTHIVRHPNGEEVYRGAPKRAKEVAMESPPSK